jgi:two-component system, cell cycle sensor histidine kinase and response regulator CckA
MSTLLVIYAGARVLCLIRMNLTNNAGKFGSSSLRNGELELTHRAIFGQCPVGLVTVDLASGAVVDFNLAAARQLGYTAEEFAGLGIQDFEADESPEEVRRHLQLVDSQGADEFETRQRAKTGEMRDVLVTVRKMELGGRRLANCVFQDITALKRAQRALLESEAQFRSAMEYSAIGMALLDPNGRFIRVNSALCRILGYEEEEMLEKDYRQVTHPDDVALSLACGEEIWRGRKISIQTEKRYLRKDGRVIWGLVSLSMIRDDAGKAREVIAQVEDITERKEALDQLQVQTAALKAAANGIVITDTSGNIEWVNDAFMRMTGYAFEEVKGKNPRVLKSGKLPEALYREMWQTIQAGRVWQGRVINRRRDGSFYDEEMTITPVLERNGSISHFIAVKQDVTRKLQAEKQMLRSQRLESIGRLAGGIAHDLNNALAPVLMSVEWLRLENPGSAKVIELLESSARRGADMVKQLVSFARGAEGERLIVQTRHLAKELERILRSTFPKAIQVRCEFAKDVPPVLGDATQVHQVLLNLCVNARDAMPGGGLLTLRIGVEEVDETYASSIPDARPGRFVAIAVQDTGAGIPPEIQDRIFEPFFTTKGPDKGTGLGLSTAIGIVQGHGGFIRVSSTVGHGSTFTVYLPAFASDTPGDAAVASSPIVWRADGQTVLVIDDEPAVREVTHSVLARLNLSPVSAEDGAEGIAVAVEHREKLCAVITDLQMPHMDGVSFVRALRRILPGVPVIVACGRLDPEMEAELEALGVRDILQKPFTEWRLAEALQAVLNGEKACAEAAMV